MTSRERVYRCLNFDHPDRAPRDLWYLAGVSMLRAPELERMLDRFPMDFEQAVGRYGEAARTRGTVAEVGTYTDAWGCVWSVAEIGVCGEVKHPPLADWAALEDYSAPWEMLKGADFSATDAQCEASDRFVKAGTEVRPFERMQFLRGTENLLMDLTLQPPELFELRDLLHEFFMAELELWCSTKVDAISFMDDWGAQGNLLISPDLWRSFFKPMYKDYCDLIKGAGKRVFFHSDGCIRAIIPDLIEVGVDALNSQLFCMDIEEIGRSFQGQITFWGEICRQNILPFGTPEEVRAAVRRVRKALDRGNGGVIAQCEWGIRDPVANIEAVFETWSEE
ncbi:MAG: hypothetical protein IT365_00560 [Candidatus Hydrogenedentes bacterium]|nr:hypothetical protein [Candidatus Hydrogenedentota bacterium]